MSQFNAPTYDIERPTGVCAFTGDTLQPGDPYIATLIEVPLEQQTEPNASGFKRIDVSVEQWEAGNRPDHLFCYWKATVPVHEEKKKLFVDDDVLLNLFRRLEDTDQEERLAFRFVLGLILMRKRVLRYEATEKREEDTEWWLLTAKAPQPGAERESLAVLNPHLDDERITQVTEQLSQILEAEL